MSGVSVSPCLAGAFADDPGRQVHVFTTTPPATRSTWSGVAVPSWRLPRLPIPEGMQGHAVGGSNG